MFVEVGKPIVDILEEHLEELAVLWRRLRAAEQSAEYRAPELCSPRERFAAHVDGLILGGEASQPVLLAGLGSDAPAEVAAAAVVLLRLGDDGVSLVFDAFQAAQGAALRELVEAVAQCRNADIESRLRICVERSPALVAAAAGEVLARYGQRQPLQHRLTDFLTHDDPAVRRIAWRVGALMDGGWADQGMKDH